ncbi:MAG: M14 family metallopeptidase, partial [Acidobacteriota bacterium]
LLLRPPCGRRRRVAMAPLLILPLLVTLSASAAQAGDVPSPAAFLSHPVGEDRYLARYPTVLAYLRAVAGSSDRVSIETAGQSTLGNEMATVVVTSAENQKHLGRYREIARQLANPDTLGPAETERLLASGKVIVLVTCSIHSTEVGSTQMAMEFVHEMATTNDPRVLKWLDDVILLLMPSINPDGQIKVIDWYNRYLGTEYEGGPMPWLYHHYVGHDNNRDFYMLTQAETRVVNDVLYHRWFPQVYLDEHQMGSTGPRMFVPPQTDPLAPEVHSLIFRQADLLGTGMALRLEEAGKTGVGSNMIYDSYWPGGTRNTAWWKNVTGLLTEVASARLATPIRIEPGELQGGRKGLPEYKRRANYPSPWPGGWWRLRDIIDYELIATKSLLETCSGYRRDILANFTRMAHEAIHLGETTAPAAFIVEPDQHDPVAAARLVELLLRHGVRVQRAAEELSVGRRRIPAGTAIIPAAQPYRAFLLTMLRPQRYPEVIPYVGGPVIPPYDVTSWSLPISMGVDVREVPTRPVGRVEALDRPDWPGPAAGRPAGGWRLSHAADSAYPLMNRLLAGGHDVYWLESPAAEHDAGDIWIPPDALPEAQMRALARELHAPLMPLARQPDGEARQAHPVRVGLYKPWVASMDEGWTRWLLERYGFDLVSLANADIAGGTFKERIDVMILPDVTPSIIATGRPEQADRRRRVPPLPPEYAGGLGDDGAAQLAAWVREDGGAIVALDSSADYVIEQLDLPVTNVLAGDASKQVVCPGSMLRLKVDTTDPLAWGLQPEEVAYFASSPAFRTSPPDARFTRRVIAAYPDDERDILVSGYIEGAEVLERRAAMVSVTVGAGRAILIGFRAQHRAQPLRTFKLLFNSLYVPGLTAAQLPPG